MSHSVDRVLGSLMGLMRTLAGGGGASRCSDGMKMPVSQRRQDMAYPPHTL